jgi:hypothetical protein
MERRGAFPTSPLVADGINLDPSGQHYLLLQYWARPHDLSQVAMSDIVRFVVLHLHGGVYVDIDIILLRDFRPLLLHGSDWAERWGALSGKGDYNTAILRLHAQSSLSTWFLRTGMRLALNFHPRVLGNQLRKDRRSGELLMLESATFDPVWVEFATMREGAPTMPCLKDFKHAFEADGDEHKGNRTFENFYNGSYAYHIHNLVSKASTMMGKIANENSGIRKRNQAPGSMLSRRSTMRSSEVKYQIVIMRSGLWSRLMTIPSALAGYALVFLKSLS